MIEVDFGIGWIPCPFGRVMQVDSMNLSGTIQCPEKGPLCGSFKISLPQISPPVTTPPPITQPVPSEPLPSLSSPQTVGLVFGTTPWRALYDSPPRILMLISKMEEFIVQFFGIPKTAFKKPRVTLYFNDTVVVLIDFLPSSLLNSDAIVSKLKDRLSSPAGISFSLYYSPFAVTKIESPSSIHALPPSPFDDTTPPSNTPLIVAAVSGVIAAVAILWVIGFCFRIKTPKRPASMTSADGISLPPAGVYPLNSRTLFLSNSEVDARSSHHPYVHPLHLQHMGRENPVLVSAV